MFSQMSDVDVASRPVSWAPPLGLRVMTSLIANPFGVYACARQR